MIVRLGWRDLIYAVIWIVTLAIPFLAVAAANTTITSNMALVGLVAYFSTVPGGVFTAWYVGRRKQP